jgi:hypothetical protein
MSATTSDMTMTLTTIFSRIAAQHGKMLSSTILGPFQGQTTCPTTLKCVRIWNV